MSVTLRPYQVDAIEAAREKMRAGAKRVLLVSPTGCHAPGQLLRRAGGGSVFVEDVKVGDELLGPDYLPRKVLGLNRGLGTMVKIVPSSGQPWVVNDEHILTLWDSYLRRLWDIKVSDYASGSRDGGFRRGVSDRYQILRRNPNGDEFLDFTIRPYGEGEFYGFTLDSDGRYLLEDFTITHNSGKTVIGSTIIESAVRKGSRALFVAHRRELILQASAKLTEIGVEHGIVMPGHPRQPAKPVQVASIQTLLPRLHELEVDLIELDECHHATLRNSYGRLIKAMPKATVIGLTATPERMDGAGLGDIFDAMTEVTTPRKLRDEGFLVRVGGWAYEEINTTGVSVLRGEYDNRQLSERASKGTILGNIVKEWLQWSKDKRTIVYAVDIAHSKRITEKFVEAGVKAEHVDGTTPKAERAAILDRLRSGETHVVSNAQILTEGFDLPELETVVLACPTLSTTKHLQCIGRALRTALGKEIARIHDHAGNLKRHGHPYSERRWELKKTAKNKVHRKLSGGVPLVTTITCPKCNSITSGWPCDNCKDPGPVKQLTFTEDVDRRFVEEFETVHPEVELKRRELAGRRSVWKGHNEHWKLDFWQKMVQRHGLKRAVHVYRWASGDCEWPPMEWRIASGEKPRTPQMSREGFWQWHREGAK